MLDIGSPNDLKQDHGHNRNRSTESSLGLTKSSAAGTPLQGRGSDASPGTPQTHFLANPFPQALVTTFRGERPDSDASLPLAACLLYMYRRLRLA